ncbi:MAG: hypothetical protein LKE33_01395 [Acidaminococcus sp.]|jgi:hypothetical protein|nr:hypothetical protein [Acidaminococcus sp.]MCI2099661.1 hypothetical protein [Acidaminococcus sp.]MCI2113934.1 hypothetical protein [Acidaminococcus sp.]MCI2115829.1 hypothetical protein [Acidaminococcus sp.]
MSTQEKTQSRNLIVPAIDRGTFVCLAVLVIFFAILGSIMGISNMFSTMFNTAWDLMINTIWYLTGILVLTGGLVSLMSEFGVIALLNRILSPLMKPLYNLPGAVALGIVTCYMGDSPAIVSLGRDKGFIKYFTYAQRALLSNLGATFAMGLTVTTFMLGLSADIHFGVAVLIGNIAAICASIISVRLMAIYSYKYYGDKANEMVDEGEEQQESYDIMTERKIREGGIFSRVMGSLLDGGKSGVDIGLSIIPGNVIICTLVMMLTRGPSASGAYTGKAMQGIALLPAIAEKLSFILDPLFGFSSPEAIAFPCTAVGSVGASLGLVTDFLAANLIGPNDIAVFTAMGMTFSGYLSVHVAMMDSLGCRDLAGKAVLTHTVAGLCAGIIAHWLYIFASTML